MSLLHKVSSAIRILRWDRDVSARASHLVVKKDLLITYESVILDQAGSENVSGSTVSFERKLMSTKTSFKRIAAVAVLALSLGGLSAVSANAAATGINVWHGRVGGAGGCNAPDWTCWDIVNDTSWVVVNTPASYGFVNQFLAGANGDSTSSSWTLTSATKADGSVIAGWTVPAIAVTAVKDTDANVAALPFTGGNPLYTGSLLLTGTDRGAPDGPAVVRGTPTTNGFTATTTAGSAGGVIGNFQNEFTPTVAGTYVWTLTSATGQVHTWTINAYADSTALTVATDKFNGIDNVTSAAKSTVILNSGESIGASADAAAAGSMALASSAVATIAVTQKNAAGDAITTSKATALSATISGPGSLSFDTTVANLSTRSNGTGRSLTASNGTFGVIGVWADGTAGTATINVYSGTTLLGTKKVVFYGKTAKLAATTKINYVANSNVAKLAVFSVTATDSNGNVVSNAAPTVSVATADAANFTSSTCTEVVASLGTYNCSLRVPTTATEGSLTVTFTASDVTTVTTTAKTNISSNKAATVTITASTDTIDPFGKVTYTLTAKDAAGFPVADGDHVLFAALNPVVTSNVTTGAFNTDTVTTVDGVATSSINAPVVGSLMSLTWTLAAASNDVDAAIANTTLPVVTTAITNAAADSAQAAIDAAQEATDAANAAYDAANNAMDSADAATAAAQDASDNASAALAAVTDLAATVAKLVASVNAIASALAKLQAVQAKIQKKLKA